MQPGIEVAVMHSHHTADAPYPKLITIISYERIPYWGSLAKYAAAFFRISRSSSTRFSSAFRRANSA